MWLLVLFAVAFVVGVVVGVLWPAVGLLELLGRDEDPEPEEAPYEGPERRRARRRPEDLMD